MTAGSSAPDPSPLPGSGPAPVIGRQDAVERVTAAARLGAGAVVTGERGMGRRTVVRAAADRLASEGEPVVRADGPGGAGGPFVEAFATLRAVLPGVPPDVVDAGTLAEVEDALLAHGELLGPGRPVVVVGEVEDLDGSSAAVLHQLVAAGRIALLGTARSDDPDRAGPGSAEASAGWWRNLVEHVPLGPLDRAAADDLVEALVGGAVDSAGRERMWSYARGHPGWVVAVVDTARAAGGWERSSGLWSLTGDLDALVDGAVLAEVVRAPGEVRSAVGALALAGTLPIAAAEALDGPAALAEAERRGLVVAEEDEHGALWCRPVSDLVAVAARSGLDGEATAARWARIADVLAGETSADGEVAIVRALAVVRSGRSPRSPSDDADLVVAGAGAAFVRSRWDAAAELAEVAWRRGGGSDALRILTQTWAQVGDHASIRRLSSELDGADVTPEDAAYHAETIAISQFHLGDADGAWSTFDRARAEASPAVRGIVDMAESRLRAFAGQPAEAARIAERWLGTDDPGVRITALQVTGSAALHQGRFVDAIAVFDEALALAFGLPGALPSLAGVPYLFRLSVCTDLGRLDEALEGALAVEAEVAAEGDPSAHGWLALHLGRTALTIGRPVTAVRWFGESVSDLRRVHRPGWLGYPSAGLVAAHVLAGDLDAAAEARERWLEIPAHAVSLFRSEELRLDATYLAARGQVAEADAQLRDAVALAERNEAAPYRAQALHALARLGTTASRGVAAVGLEALAASSDSPLIAAHARRARAVADGDAPGLAAVAPDYEGMGARLDALECWAEVARLPTADDRGRAHARRRVAELREEGEPLVTPLLAGVEERPVLTAREAEIVSLVAGGASRQEIAAHLVVSVRTIDSHLQRVYRKLGVRGRDDLAALDIDPPTGVAGGP